MSHGVGTSDQIKLVGNDRSVTVADEDGKKVLVVRLDEESLDLIKQMNMTLTQVRDLLMEITCS